jgi:hypothetical protein
VTRADYGVTGPSGCRHTGAVAGEASGGWTDVSAGGFGGVAVGADDDEREPTLLSGPFRSSRLDGSTRPRDRRRQWLHLSP